MELTLFDKYDLTPLPPMPTGKRPNKVVNVKRVGVGLDFVYVGRQMGDRYRGHILANPYRLRKGSTRTERRSVILQYSDWLNRQLDIEVPAIRQAFNALPGKTLGCWCGDWDGQGEPGFDCHAVELIRMLRERGLA